MKAGAIAAAALVLGACSKDAPAPPAGAAASVAPEAGPAASAAPAPSAGDVPAVEASASTDASPPAPSAAAAALDESVARSSVKLLDPGRPPRRALRYAWHLDRKEQMSVVLRTSVSMAAAGQQQDMPLPSLHVDVAVDPSGATPDGDLRFAWHVTSTSAEADAGAPAEVARGWVAQVAPVEHLSGTGAVSAHGLTRGVTVDPGTAGDAGPDAEMVVQVVQMLRDVAVPLPVEPIGAGARWQKLSSLEARKGRATETDTFTLAEIAGDLGTVDDVVAQTATPQALPPLVGVPSASPARVDSVLMSGSARSRFDLGRLVPQTQLDATTSMGVSAPARDRMQMVLRLAIGIGGSVR